jgi:hypothetical protein
MRRVHPEDQRGRPPLVELSVTAFPETADPGAIVGAAGDRDPAQQLGAEPVTQPMDEREALRAGARWINGSAASRRTWFSRRNPWFSRRPRRNSSRARARATTRSSQFDRRGMTAPCRARTTAADHFTEPRHTSARRTTAPLHLN